VHTPRFQRAEKIASSFVATVPSREDDGESHAKWSRSVSSRVEKARVQVASLLNFTEDNQMRRKALVAVLLLVSSCDGLFGGLYLSGEVEEQAAASGLAQGGTSVDEILRAKRELLKSTDAQEQQRL